MALSGKGALGRFIELRYREWLDKRIPPAETIRLNQKNVFIFPVALSFAYILCVAILWIAATNYENNLAFAMCFLLLSLFVITILHTFNNLSGLVLGRLDCPPVFSGNLAECRIMVSALNQRSYHSITLCWDDDYKTVLDLEPGEKKKVVCKVRVNKRGYFSPGRLRIETVYPLGILRSWSYVNLDFRILVYPKPLKFELPALGANSQEQGDFYDEISGGEEFNSLKDYFAGAPLRHLAWKQYAKGRGLHVKDYSQFVDRQLFFDWDKMPLIGVEDKLSAICYWVLEAENRGEVYGVRLPGFEKLPDKGREHQADILRALALFGAEA